MEVSSIDDMKFQEISADAMYIGDLKIWGHGIYEYTGSVPFAVKTDGTSIIDWKVFGSENGVGKLGTNLLPQREYAQSDGLSNGSLDPSYLGNIEIEFYPGGGATTHDMPAIPPGTPNTGAYQQWIGMEPGGTVNDWAIDERTNHLYPPDFQNAQWKTTLPAGSYKLHCELIMINGEIGNFRDVYNRQTNYDSYATVDLLTSTGTILIHRNVASRYNTPSEDVLFANYDANYGPAFFHEEIPFTLAEETEIGMITKLYWWYSDRHDLYFRFYITDASVTAVPFDDGTYSGVTAWEPYRATLTLKVEDAHDSENSQEIVLNLPKVLYAEDVATMSEVGTTLPTYLGKTKISVIDGGQPSQMYVKYKW